MWKKTVEVEITPVAGTNREITAAIKEERRQNFLDIGALAEDIAGAKGANRWRIIGTILLTIEAATELYKTASTFPSSPNYPTLDQVFNHLFGAGLESPFIVGATAAIGAYYLGKRALDERSQIKAAFAGLHRAQISPVDLRVSPIDSHFDDGEDESHR